MYVRKAYLAVEREMETGVSEKRAAKGAKGEGLAMGAAKVLEA